MHSTSLATLRTRHALALPLKAKPISEGKLVIVPWPEPRWLVEPEEQPVLLVPVAELTVLEMPHVPEPEHDVAVGKLQHQPGLPEVSRLKPWRMPELEPKTTALGVPEVPRLERPRLANEAPAVVQLEALVSQVQLRRGVP